MAPTLVSTCPERDGLGCPPAEGDMRAFTATVVTLTAAGVLLIAYGLLNPRTTAADPYAYPGTRSVVASPPAGVIGEGAPYGRYATIPYTADRPALVYPVNNPRPIPV